MNTRKCQLYIGLLFLLSFFFALGIHLPLRCSFGSQDIGTPKVTKNKQKRQHKNHYTIKLRLYFLGCSSSGSGFGVGSLKDSGLSSLPGPTGSQAVLPAEKFLMACVNSRGS